uniref:uncharacterized protein LOC118541112 n=1 Tax=Halichoerus grypus TaxID=9711 RepID=UPI001658E0F5|nr:uncharacterized protein LOC118541112 [Halichoerus grypus]
MATPGMCTDTVPTTAQAFFLGSVLLLATESVTLFVTGVTLTSSLPLRARSGPEEGALGPGVKPEAQVCFLLSGNFQSSGPSHSGGEPKQPQDSGHRGMMTSASEVPQPVSPELLRMTNLRVNFSKLHTLGDRPLGGLKRHPFYDYALYELVARGSCLCHGHASECKPIAGTPADVKGMVHGLCVCRHHTAGTHCERCQDLHRTTHGMQQSLGTLSLPGVLILPLTKLCMSTLGSPHPLPAASRGAFKPCAHALSSCNRQSQYVTSQAPDLPVLSPPTCSLLQPEFWGLSSDSLGCRPCNCDFGVPTATGVLLGRASARAALTSVAAAAMNSNLGTSVLPLTKPLLKLSLTRSSSQLTPSCLAVVLSRPFCFELGTRYSLILRLCRTKGMRRPEGGTILLDSIVLLPWVKELPGLRSVDPGATEHLQELHKAGCVEAARTGLPSTMPEVCAHLVCSISALLHGGGLACECHPQGSLNTECTPLGGQCPCHPNIIGRTCDCMSEIYSIGPTGCSGKPSGPARMGVGSGTNHLLSPHGLTALSFPTECHCHTEGPLVPFVTL